MHAEIAGAGFAGLAAAIALRQRGWSVRVHEKEAALRAFGAGIFVWENGLRVLHAIGAYDDVVRGAHSAVGLRVAPRRGVRHLREGERGQPLPAADHDAPASLCRDPRGGAAGRGGDPHALGSRGRTAGGRSAARGRAQPAGRPGDRGRWRALCVARLARPRRRAAQVPGRPHPRAAGSAPTSSAGPGTT